MKRMIAKAKSVLAQYNINQAPIDVAWIARENKIIVAERDNLPEDISGALDLRDNKPIILINGNQHIHRKRFTIAHELGHFFLNHTDGVHIDKKLFFRNQTSSLGASMIEREANRFAAELLMPEDMLTKDL